MLVLTRKENEQIQIGDQVIITVLQVKGQSVRIGIDAPREVLVLRAELPRHETVPVENSPTEAVTPVNRAGLSPTRRTNGARRSTTSTRRIPDRTRPTTDTRRHPDRARSLAPRPSFLNHL